jgi:hypothetical protein
VPKAVFTHGQALAIAILALAIVASAMVLALRYLVG